MPPEHRFRSAFLLASAPVLLAAALRLHGVDWGLPDLFEEATPFFRSWQMWGWDRELRFDPDPHFYRYPSLTFYVHALAEAVLLVPAWISGGGEAVREVSVDFLEDRTPFLLASRWVSALFGVGAVAGVYALGRRVGGRAVGLAAGLFLAANGYHVERSQFIEVDAALGFFVAWGLWACVRLAEAATPGRYVVAGAFLGLAASSKYPGALLIVPLLTAHALILRSPAERARWRSRTAWLALSGLVAFGVFAATSPFVLVNLDRALEALAFERQHMEIGHFGVDDAVTWKAYAVALSRDVLGWPLGLAAVAGMIVAAAVRRHAWSLVLLAFVVAYAGIVSSWSMRTERYLLPLVPPLIVFAASLLGEAHGRARTIAATGLAIVLLAASAWSLPRVYERIHPDTRTLAREWIESKCPAGSFLVMEAWGPDLLEPEDVWSLSPSRRASFLRRDARKLFAIQNLPTYQVMPELSEAFYEIRVFADADFFVLSSDVGDRYRRDPDRYARQVAFYEELESRLRKVASFGPADGHGPRITVYFQPQSGPFARRPEVAGPQPLSTGLRRPPPGEAAFYRDLGLNYETFGFVEAARDCYTSALASSSFSPDDLERIGLGLARCLLARGDAGGVGDALRDVAGRCTIPSERERILRHAERADRAAGSASP